MKLKDAGPGVINYERVCALIGLEERSLRVQNIATDYIRGLLDGLKIARRLIICEHERSKKIYPDMRYTWTPRRVQSSIHHTIYLLKNCQKTNAIKLLSRMCREGFKDA